MMAGRGGTKPWTVLLLLAGLLACVGLVAVCFLRDAGPSSVPSSSGGPADPCGPQGAVAAQIDAVATSERAAVEPNDGTSADLAVGDASELTDSLASQSIVVPEAQTSVPLTPGFALRGCVVYQDGTPYREILGTAEMLSVHVTAPDYLRKCEIDDEGRFECAGLDAGSYTVSVVDALASRRVLCHSAHVELHPEVAFEEVLLVLGQEVPVVVRVLDERSLAPRADCSVTVQSMQAVSEISGETDVEGLCEFSLIGGQYRIDVSRWQEGGLTEVVSKLVRVKSTDAALTVDLLVPAADAGQGMIRGVLVDAAGNPIEGYVMLEHTPQTSSGEVGTAFAIPEPDRQPPEGLLGYARDVSGSLGRRFLWPQGDPNEVLTLVLEPHTSVVGQVVGTDRKPVSEVDLDLQVQMLDGTWRGADNALDTPLIDSEGYFAFDRIPVGVRVRVAAYRGTLSGNSHRLNLKAGEPADAGQIVMTGRHPGTGIIEGRITDENGESVADRRIRVQIGRHTQWLRTNGGGYFTLSEMPEGQPLNVTIEVDPYGPWSRTAIPDDYRCDFQLCPQGWGVVDQQAPPLLAGKWFNHAPVTLEQLRGRVVLLTFRNLDRDTDPGLARIRALQNEFEAQGLLVIAVYNHLPSTSQVAEDIVAEHLLSLFQGASIAGLLDADPALVADLMPAERPAGANGGATHWMYQVHTRPVFFLIDKVGKARHCTGKDAELREWLQRLLNE